MTNHWALFLLSVLAQLGSQCSGSRHFLYYASEARGEDQAGLWGGFVDPSNGGKSENLKRSGFHCAEMKRGYYTGLRIKSMAHDPHSNSAIMELDEWSDTTVTAIKVPICNGGPSCAVRGQSTLIFDRADSIEKPQASKLGPFTMWNDSIYFIAQKFEKGANERSRTHTMEIRKLSGCDEEYPFSQQKSMDLDTCSELVAVVVQETADNIIFQMRETLKPADHLYVTEVENNLVFLIQVYNYTMNADGDLVEFSLDLLSVTPGSPANHLHHAVINQEFTYHIFNQVGGISHKEDVLCWSAMDRILCARWDKHDAVHGVKTVLQSGKAAQICTGTHEEKTFANVTSGISLVSTDNGLTLYFGCYAQETKVGGAALMKTSSDWSTIRSLQSLSDKHGKIYAGSMFLTDACSHLYKSKDDEGEQNDQGDHSADSKDSIDNNKRDNSPEELEENTKKVTPVAEKATSDNGGHNSGPMVLVTWTVAMVTMWLVAMFDNC